MKDEGDDEARISVKTLLQVAAFLLAAASFFLTVFDPFGLTERVCVLEAHGRLGRCGK